jgi:predicted DNA-binding transcriptional regulator AlpA
MKNAPKPNWQGGVVGSFQQEQPTTPFASIASLELLTREDLAAILRTTVRSVDRMRSDGSLPRPIIFVGRRPRWKRSVILDWIERGGATS